MSFRGLTLLFMLLTPLAAHARARSDPYGFPLPEGAIARLGDLHFAQPGEIRTLALSPDGKVIATGNGKRIFLWNADSGLITGEIAAPQDVFKLAFSRDGKLLAGAFWQGDVTIWHVATRRLHWPIRQHEVRSAKDFLALQFLDNDRLLAVRHNHGGLQLWDVAKGTLVREWSDKHKADLLPAGHKFIDVALSPSGEQMAWLAAPGSSDKEERSLVLLLETKSGKLLRQVKGLRASARRICLVDEGQTLVVGPSLDGPKEDAKYAVVSIPDGKVRFLCDYRYERRFTPECKAVFRNGNSLFTDDEAGLTRWDIATGKKLDAWPERSTMVARSGDGKRAVVAERSRLQVCDEFLQPTRASNEYTFSPWLQFLPDGRLSTGTWYEARSDVWDMRQGKVVKTTPGRPSWRTGWSYDSSGKVAAYRDGSECVIHDLTADKAFKLEDVTFTYYLVSPIVSGDGKSVLVSTNEKDAVLVRWFDTRTGREQGACRIRNEEIQATDLPPVDWFDRGKTVSYITHDGRWALIDCANAKVRLVVGIPMEPRPLRKDGEGRSRYSPWYYRVTGNGRYVVAHRGLSDAQTEYAVFEAAKGQMLRRFRFPPEPIPETSHLNGTLSPDGRWMAGSVCETDKLNKITLYETASGQRRGEIRAPHLFFSFAFAPDGKTLAMSCDDTTVLIWDLNRPLSGKPALPAPRTPAEAEVLWQALADPDAEAMEPALWALVCAPEQSLPFLKKHLQPARRPDPERVRMLIVRLGSPSFKERDAAAEELVRLGETTTSALREALKKGIFPLEHQRRLEKLLPRIETGIPSCLRELRAVEVLERIGSEDSRQLLETLTAGDAEALLTREAHSVLARWPGRHE